ncbi:MAG: GcrA cell cycle regulator [Acidisphaera sp.]|nr:GcrA cell cycle regulator [Acidisphaera sp.]MBV9813696.1 GcrA cell cycle regulator [Acetobacteraceae bacterium]
MDWNDELVAKLRAFWQEGHSTSEIGRRIGMSKNAVVGKAHRLHLPPRPSPIRREGDPGVVIRPPAPKRCTGPTLPPLRALAEVAPRPPVPLRPAPRPAPEPAAAAAPPPVRLVAPRIGRTVACCWPLGEPGTKSFRFCEANAADGKPYCAEHAAIAYVKIRDKREEVA